jgi:uncharacterized protein (TIGR00266 family)
VHYKISRRPAFATLFITLNPGESITAESGAMVSMSAKVSMHTHLFGGLIPALLKAFLGGESVFVNTFTNSTKQPLEVVLTQGTIGDMSLLELNNQAICLQPGAYVAHSPGVNIGLRWAGFASWIAREGLFKLKLSGTGLVFIGAYGGISQHHIDGEWVVDSGHIVAYDPGICMRVGLSSGLIGSVTSGEGLVNRLSGTGQIYLQSRSIDGLVRFLRPKV